MIGLQQEDVRGPDALDDEFGGMAEVGQETDIAGRGAKEKADGIVGVVRNRKSVHLDITEFDGCARAEEAAIELRLELGCDGLFRQSIAIDRNLLMGAQRRQSLNVVAVLVGNQNPVKA